MQYQYIGYRVKSFYQIIRYAMKADMNNEVTAQRLRVLEFWDKHGLQAALDHGDQSRRTVHAWKKAYREQRLSGSMPKAPKGKRLRRWPRAVVAQTHQLLRYFANLGKEPVHILLKPWCQAQCLPCLSESIIGRLIADAPGKMQVSPPALTPRGQAKAIPADTGQTSYQGLRPSEVGECVGMDAIERHMDHLRRYIDEVSGYALTMAVPWLNSQMTRQFFEKCFRLTPFNIQQVVTGEGSEFKGELEHLIEDSQIVHLWTYPKPPKMNAACERFNRMAQEQLVDFHEDLLFTDLELFNEKLADWLVQYNGIRPHKGLGLQIPVK